jgi:hypothetical protein
MPQFDTENVVKWLEAIGFICKTLSVNPGAIASGAEGTITATVVGAQVGSKVFATLGSDVTVGLYLRGARVTAVNTITFDYANHSGGSIDEAAHNVQVLIVPGDLN